MENISLVYSFTRAQSSLKEIGASKNGKKYKKILKKIKTNT